MRNLRHILRVVVPILFLACAWTAIGQPGPRGQEGFPRGRGFGFQNVYRMHSAAEEGDLQTLERMLNRGLLLDMPDAEGKTVLHVAALAGQTNVVEWILAHGGRMDIFAAAALGDLDRVRSYLTSSPRLAVARGPDNVTALHWATKDVALLLLEKGADVHARSAQDSTPLHEAARRNRADVVQLLLERGAEANAVNRSQATPLSLASELGYTDVAELLMAHGAKLDVFDAVALGRADELERSLNSDPTLLGATIPRNGQTLVHWAAMRGQTAILQRLLELGADVTARDRSESEPIHFAVRNGQMECIRLLLQKGADINSRNGSGFTCLHQAIESGNTELVQFVLQQGGKVDTGARGGFLPIHLAAARTNTDITELLLKHGADISSTTRFGYTPLHFAARGGHPGMVQLLLRHGADPAMRNERGETPLETALQRERWTVAREFVENDVGLTGMDGRNYSPLVLAIQNGAPKELIQLILERKPNFNEPVETGRCPLQQAAYLGRIDLLELLIPGDAYVNSRDDSQRRTPLHWAAEGGQVAMVEALLARNAKIGLPDLDGLTPLHLAAQRGHTEVVRILLSKGAEVNARKSVFEPTPLNLALDNGRRDVAELLRAQGGRTSLTIARFLLGWIAVSLVLGGAHYIWKITGQKTALPPEQA